MCEVEDGVGSVGPDVEDLVRRGGDVDRVGDHGCDVVDVRERSRLQAVAEDRHRPAAQELVQEDPDHVPVRVGEVLELAVDVVRPEDRVVEAEHPLRGAQVELDRVLPDSIGVFGLRDGFLRHRRLGGAVDGDRAGEDEALDGLGAEGGVEHVDRAENVVRVVEAPDEVRQPLRRIGGEVEDVGELVRPKQLIDELRVHDRAGDEGRTVGHIRFVAAAEIDPMNPAPPVTRTGIGG